MAELSDAYSGRQLNGSGQFIDNNQESWNELLDNRPGPTWLEEQQRNQNVVRPPFTESGISSVSITHTNEGIIYEQQNASPSEQSNYLREQLNLPGQVQQNNLPSQEPYFEDRYIGSGSDSESEFEEHISDQTQNHLPNEVPNVVEAAENIKRKGFLGFLDKMVYILSNKEKISENVPKTVSEIKMMLSDFAKIKSELIQLETKIREKETEHIKTKKELETMKNKFNELIAITDDQELVEILNKKNENNPLIAKNKILEEELNELKKEYTVLKEVCDNFNEVCPKNICKICYENDLEVFLNSCGHTFCGGCTNNIKECPTCKQKVFNVGKLYYLT